MRRAGPRAGRLRSAAGGPCGGVRVTGGGCRRRGPRRRRRRRRRCRAPWQPSPAGGVDGHRSPDVSGWAIELGPERPAQVRRAHYAPAGRDRRDGAPSERRIGQVSPMPSSRWCRIHAARDSPRAWNSLRRYRNGDPVGLGDGGHAERRVPELGSRRGQDLVRQVAVSRAAGPTHRPVPKMISGVTASPRCRPALPETRVTGSQGVGHGAEEPADHAAQRSVRRESRTADCRCSTSAWAPR